MSGQERQGWDERFRSGSHVESQPDPFLLSVESFSTLFPASPRALDVACGAGRHAIWLAQHRWHVTACDISVEGLRRARTLAEQQNVRLDLFCADLEQFALPSSRFDLVVCFFYLQRELLASLKAAVRPGGLIVYKTYTTEQLRFRGGPTHPMHLLQPQELLRAFKEFRVLHYEETVQDRGIAQIIAQRA